MKTCELCKRKSLKIYSRSHSMRQSIRHQKTNVQTLFYQGKRIVACASCIQAQKKATS